ncbi:MAG: L,D-transpeptidase family protein [Planctomycetota bacterium]
MPTVACVLVLLSAVASAAAAAHDEPIADLISGSAALFGSGDAALSVAEDLAPLAQRVFLGPEALPGMERLGLRLHSVARGEYPGTILKRYGMRNELLQLLNPTYDDRRLGAGQQLKVLDLRAGELRALAVRHAYRLGLVLVRRDLPHPVLVAWVPVGVGAAGSETPLGQTTVATMARNCEWTHPDSGEVIPADDPRNILGGYWIGLAPGSDGRFRSIGLHGYTGAPAADWLEQGGSHGCLRLRQNDIAAVYALFSIGTPITIAP